MRFKNLAANLLVVAAALLVSLALVEVALRWSGWHQRLTEPPAWLRSFMVAASGPPSGQDPISDVVLPRINTEFLALPPDAFEVAAPPGKPVPPPRSEWQVPPISKLDPIVGATLNPGAEGWFMSEGLAYITINAEGFRDRDHAVAKDADVVRVVVLGDSFAEALQVPQENTFWSVIERRLLECPALGVRRVEALNFGVSGYGTTQELLIYRHFARKYKPDVVLLAFYIGNDLRDNVYSLSLATNYPVSLIKPFYTIVGNELVLDDGFLRRWPHAQNASQAMPPPGPLWPWLGRLRISQLVGMIYAWTKIKDQRPVDERALLSPPDRDYAEAWAVTERVLTVLAAEVKADGGRLVVATVSAAEQVDPDIKRRLQVASSRGILDLFYPDKRFYRLSGRAGFHMIPLASAMAEVAERSQKYFHGFANNVIGQGHWNHIGHEVAGQILAREICTSGLSRP